MAVNRVRQDAASGKHAGDQFVMAADLGNGEGVHLPRRVKPRPPRLAKRRSLNVEKVVRERQNSALDPATRQPANHLPQSES
jgi:hypothetical protein